MATAIDIETDIKWPRFPYPGLRPFRITRNADESLIFCGRSSHRDDVLERLDESQFVSVVGPSGCGKSSLVKVGIIPVLKAGLLTRAGYDWQSIEMRPGQDPLGALAAALAKLNTMGDGPPGMEQEEIAALLATRRSALWMVVENMADRFQSAQRSAKPTRVLLLLDQFEEIFSGIADPKSVDRFITLITQFFANPHPQLFIVLTMRTDFISQCANFPGLAEILNKTQYITPVLRGQGLIDAIERPVRTYGGEIEPELVTTLVRDMGSGVSYDADHLPLMQHALLWLWQQAWQATGQPEPPHPGQDRAEDAPGLRLTVQLYQEHGGLHGILNRHADAIFEQLRAGPGGQRRAAIAEILFRRLSERDASARYKRAPAYADEVCRTAQCTLEDLNAVVEPYADGDTSFVERRPGHAPDDPLLDLSHESLIRQWDRLRGWADAEADKLAAFRKAAGDAIDWEQHGKRRSFLKGGGQLSHLLEWWHDNQPTGAWASRYTLTEGKPGSLAHSLPLVEEFRDASLRNHNNIKWLRRGVFVLVPLLVLLGVTISYWSQLREDRAFRIASAAMLESDASDHHQPAKALQIALTFLRQNPDVGDVSEIQSLAYRALRHLHETRILSAGGLPFSVDWSPDGRWLMATAAGIPTVWDARDPDHGPALGTLVTGADEASYMRTQWNPRGGQMLLVSRGGQTVTLAAVDDSGGHLAIRPGSAIKLRIPPSSPNSRVGLGMFSGDGRKVLTGAFNAPLRVWDAATGALLAADAQPIDRFGIAGNFDGSLLAVPDATAGVDVFAFDGTAIKQLSQIAPHIRPSDAEHCTAAIGRAQVRALAFDPQDPHLLVFSAGCRVFGADVQSQTILFQLGDYSTEVSKIAFSDDGRQIATGAEDNLVRVYNTPDFGHARPSRDGESFGPKAILGAHHGAVLDLRFSPDGKWLVSSGRDNELRIWSIAPVLRSDPTLETDKPAGFVAEATRYLPQGIEPLESLVVCLIGGKACLNTPLAAR